MTKQPKKPYDLFIKQTSKGMDKNRIDLHSFNSTYRVIYVTPTKLQMVEKSSVQFDLIESTVV